MTVYLIDLTDKQIGTISQINRVLIFSDINNLVRGILQEQKALPKEEADKSYAKSIEELYVTVQAASEMSFTTNILKATWEQVNGGKADVKRIPISSTDLEVIDGVVRTITVALEQNRGLIPSHIPIHVLEDAIAGLRKSIDTVEEFTGLPGVPATKPPKTSMMN